MGNIPSYISQATLCFPTNWRGDTVKGIVSTSGNPGNLKTDLQRYTPGAFMMLMCWMFSPAPSGALTPLYGGISAPSVDLNGKYLIPWARVGAMRKEAEDPKLGEKLWTWLEEQTKE